MWKIFDKSDKESAAAFDRFVTASPNCHFMQTTAWAAVKIYWDWRGIMVCTGGKIIAAMLVLIRPLPLGFSILYAPRGPVCDRSDPGIWAQLMEGLKHLAKEKRAILLHLDPDEPDSSADFREIMNQLGFSEKADEGFGNIQPQYVFRLNLKGTTAEEIFQKFSAKTRYNIGLSQRKGVSVLKYAGASSIPDSVFEQFYTLMLTTGQRDHFYVRDQNYFRRLLAKLQDDAHIYLAYWKGVPIAGSIAVFCGNKAWYLYGASGNENRNTMPNYLLQWTMIRDAIAKGCGIYDFRGVPGDVSETDPLYGLYRFKKGFSGVYTKFTGLYSYEFRPSACKLLQIGIRLRRQFRGKMRNHK